MPAQVTVRYWAGARRAAGRDSEELLARDIADLREQLAQRPELASVIAASSVLVDSAQTEDDHPLQAGAVVDVLPPFAGG